MSIICGNLCHTMKANLNNVRKLREAKMMSKAELARKAGISVLTVDRIEKGYPCRLDTKRKIVLALGFRVPEAEKVFRNSGKSEAGKEQGARSKK